MAQFEFDPLGNANMPVIKTFSANGKLVSEVDEPLNEFNIERFIDQDEDRAKIYLEAMAEFTAALEGMVLEKWPSGQFVSNSPHMCRKLTTKFYYHNSNVLEVGKKIMDKRSIEKPASL